MLFLCKERRGRETERERRRDKDTKTETETERNRERQRYIERIGHERQYGSSYYSLTQEF